MALPIPGDGALFVLPSQRVQAKPGNVHVFHHRRGLQGGEEHPKPLRLVGLDPRHASRLEELLESLVPERLNHEPTIARCASRNNPRLNPCWAPCTCGRPRVVDPGGRLTQRAMRLGL